MKKFLLSLGLISALVIAGCSQSETDEETNGDDNSEEQSTDEQSKKEEESSDNAEVKKELLSAQMDFTSKISPYQQKINAYQASLADEEATDEDIQKAADEALTAAGEAQSELDGYKIEANVPEDIKERYEQAIAILAEYYSEAEAAIEESALEPDFTAAQEKWDNFQSSITDIYEGEDMFAPNMADALS
ncbi:hypothetical protein [Sediminibacillus albus]|uniref:Lipoprotein n=1 Tax=Sediminibacillus albus TaxID=407036 RepID=A0A1G8VQI1_9BACI|nr:hypothetical protein [Sediminibacillus albus]SDJ68209.1 hypothetical protein SAMN05216243_0277 [Sediminibacillus albus]